MKVAIVYYSKHHGNTKKLLDAISAEGDVTLVDSTQAGECDLTGYDLIGFASGIYYSKFHKSVIEIAERKLPVGKTVFFLYTCGAMKEGYTKAMEEAAAKRQAKVKGTYGCFGFDTFGPLKLIGGMAKGHPNQSEIAAAKSFFKRMLA